MLHSFHSNKAISNYVNSLGNLDNTLNENLENN